jgi:3-methyladenine DNA glycosylase AlkD
MTTSLHIKDELKALIKPDKAIFLPYFFKTGEGQYAAGDKFIGVVVPDQRTIAKKYYKDATFGDLEELITSEIHEHRLTALFILILKYEKLAKTQSQKTEIVDFYLKHIQGVNNWDLVDASAPYLLGPYLYDKPRDILYEFAKSGDLWKERISIVATYFFIKNLDFKDTLNISEILLTHKHDLIHKAVGWMLREVGKKDRLVLDGFLKKHYKQMPRTMLRYAIEKHEESIRKEILRGDW